MEIFKSPLGDVSVAGYPDDKESTGNGVTEMQTVVKALGNHGMYGR